MQNSPNFPGSEPAAAKARLTYAAFGVRVGIEASPALLRRIPVPLIAGSTVDETGSADAVLTLSENRSATGQPLYEVGGSAGRMAVSTTIDNALAELQKGAEEFVAESATDFVFVHAGAVAWGGKAVLIPGRSFSGKSTLVMELVRAGATYLSDEYAVLDRSGFVHAFARAPRLREDVSSSSREGTDPKLLAKSRAERGPLPVGLVISSTYKPDAVWAPRDMTAGETLLMLIENTVAVRRQSEFTITVIKELLVSARGIKTARPEASAVAAEILRGMEKGVYEPEG